MGDGRKWPLRVNFNPRIRLEFYGARLSSDGGLLAYRELDERLGLTTMTDDWLVDSHQDLNKRHSLNGVMRPAHEPEASFDADPTVRRSLPESRCPAWLQMGASGEETGVNLLVKPEFQVQLGNLD
jgi:hypothetical protein